MHLPSVSLLTALKSSSLVACLCPIELTFDAAVDCIVLEEVVEFIVDDGNRGLHGEWEFAEVLVEVVRGTPVVDEYKSWLNWCEEGKNLFIFWLMGNSADFSQDSQKYLKISAIFNTIFYLKWVKLKLYVFVCMYSQWRMR